jgi:FkbM family methyltransferase
MTNVHKFIERYPVLQRPAYLAFAGAMSLKNIALGVGIRKFGYVPKRLSDRGQDRWVIDEVFHGKRNGYFVELGAHDGFSDSNTLVLEKRYGWSGLLIEPNPIDFAKITEVNNRTATPVPLAVDPEGGKLEFVRDGQLSGLITPDSDNGSEMRVGEIKRARATGLVRTVKAVPLERVLDKYDAPPVIDYFSLDVEGSETRILRSFPFERYTFLSMTIERPTVELNELLFSKGYHFVRNALYDTFYVHETVPNFSEIRCQPFVQLPSKKF